MSKQLKDLFYQNYTDIDPSIPNHWVVQYYEDDNQFPKDEYFETREEAAYFIHKEFGISIKYEI